MDTGQTKTQASADTQGSQQALNHLQSSIVSAKQDFLVTKIAAQAELKIKTVPPARPTAPPKASDPVDTGQTRTNNRKSTVPPALPTVPPSS